MRAFVFADFNKMLPTSRFIFDKYLDKQPADCKVLFVPVASTNQTYISRCYNNLIKLGFKSENITTLSPVAEDGVFDFIFVGGGNNAILKDKLVNWGWWNKISAMIKNNVFYIGDSAGGVILGKGFEFSLAYEPYNGNLKDFSGYGFIDRYFVMHYSNLKLANDGKLLDQSEYYEKHIEQVKNLGQENCILIGNNEFFAFTDDESKPTLHSYSWEIVQENYMREIGKC